MANKRGPHLQWFFALVSGVLFGLGLAISSMANPAKVLAFLDIAGAWDPTLLFVMAGALIVAAPAFRLVLRRPAPWFGAGFSLPTRSDIDSPLVGGAAIFGLGWGLAGLCPGPALIDLVTGNAPVLAFVAAMLLGALVHDRVDAAFKRDATSVHSR